MRLRLLAASSLLSFPLLLAAQIPADLSLQPVVSTGVVGAVGLRHAGDGSGRLFIFEQGGNIKVYEDGALLPTPFLTIDSDTPGGFTSGFESGLLGLAFHPQYASNGRLYVNYSDGSNDTRIVEYQVSGANPNLVDTSTRRQLMVIDQPAANHNGGNILFGPDGYLYIGMGDGGGSGGSGAGLSQQVTTLLGKNLRIDVDVTSSTNVHACGAAGTLAYGIPDDNPFADGGGCAEIVHTGLRNPWRWSFDRSTGDMFIGDVGQGTREEVSFVAAAELNQIHNFGWKCFEGTFVYNACPGGMDYPHVPPIVEYYRTNGNCAITGGYRYRGPISGLNGVYIYGDYCSRRIWFATEDGGEWTSELWSTPQNGGITSFGEDEQGNVYVVRQGGVPISVFHSATVGPTLFTVTPFAGTGGSIDPDTAQQVEEGETFVFTVEADPGYLVDAVTGCGGSLVGSAYTTAAITADCTVTATFVLDGDLIFENGFEN